jgi:hypothetical protein
VCASARGELVWIKRGSWVELVVLAPRLKEAAADAAEEIAVSNLRVPLVQSVRGRDVLFRHPVRLSSANGTMWTAGPVYAILAGSGNGTFVGNRSDFRDLTRTARSRRRFVYVLSASDVTDEAQWNGYVRVGPRRWICLPCPRPEAIYNRIPTRHLERQEDALRAKSVIQILNIPMFNPEYFDKAVIYHVVRAARLQEYLPETSESLSRAELWRMLRSSHSVYLKPSGGSIGHGVIRVEKNHSSYTLKVLKKSRCFTFHAADGPELWQLLRHHRLPGKYVVQSAVRLVEWQGRPCDVRVLLQKSGGQWGIVGKGVRVAGENTITTHVPNGGFILDVGQMLQTSFGPDHQRVEEAIDAMVIRCAEAIDRHYQGRLGEMSMDVGVDEDGRPWFFEANAKPMKFDEPDIRARSLRGVLRFLDELRAHSRNSMMKREDVEDNERQGRPSARVIRP